MANCILTKIPDGFECTICGWRYFGEQAPKRNCGIASTIKYIEGAGTELKILIQKFGIQPYNCGCQNYVDTMNEKGIDWCEENINMILGWLEEGAEKRELPFIRVIAKLMVKRAIRNARRKLKVNTCQVKKWQ